MTERKMPLEEICEAWRREQREVASGHLPISTLFDLVQQSLIGGKKTQVFKHLAVCPVCLQALRELMRIKGKAMPVEKLLVAADSPPLALSVKPAHPLDRLVVNRETASAPSLLGSSPHP
jgi:hypothetical protein